MTTHKRSEITTSAEWRRILERQLGGTLATPDAVKVEALFDRAIEEAILLCGHEIAPEIDPRQLPLPEVQP